MSNIKSFVGAAVGVVLGTAVSAQEDVVYQETFEHHADANMYCVDDGAGGVEVYDLGKIAVSFSDESVMGSRSAAGALPLGGFEIVHAPDFQSASDSIEQIWDRPNVTAYFNYQMMMYDKVVTLSMSVNDALAPNGEIIREGAHCTIQMADDADMTRHTYHMPLLQSYDFLRR